MPLGTNERHTPSKLSMKRYSRRTLRGWFDPRSILFGITVFNFVLLWYTANTMTGACVVCPWYYPWTYFNEPTLLLLAAISVLLSRKWSYGIALCLSGYLIGYLIYRFWLYDISVIQTVRQFSPYQEAVYAWQIQYLLALITFVLATFYLAQAVLRNPINDDGIQ